MGVVIASGAKQSHKVVEPALEIAGGMGILPVTLHGQAGSLSHHSLLAMTLTGVMARSGTPMLIAGHHTSA